MMSVQDKDTLSQFRACWWRLVTSLFTKVGYWYPSTVIKSGTKALLQSESCLTFKLHRLHVIEELNCHCVFQYFRDRLLCLIMHFSLIEQEKKWILLLLTPVVLFLCFGIIVIHAGMSRTPWRPG